MTKAFLHYLVVAYHDALGFECAYTVAVDPEFPGDGDWGCPVSCRYSFNDPRLGRHLRPLRDTGGRGSVGDRILVG